MENETNQMVDLNEPESQNTVAESSNSGSAEKVLKIIAYAVLGIGIIGSLIMMGTITNTTICGEYSWETQTVVNPFGVITTIATIISSVVTYGVLMVIANISTSLKEINSKMK